MKLKNNKAFMIILFFIFFILLNNVSFGASLWEPTGQDWFMVESGKYLYYSYINNLETWGNDSIDRPPTINDFDTMAELSRFELYRPWIWVNYINLSGYKKESAYFFLAYYNEEHQQALFYYYDNNPTTSSTYIGDFYNRMEIYYLDEKNGIFQKIHTSIESTARASVHITLNSDKSVKNIQIINRVVGFTFNQNNECGFIAYSHNNSTAVITEYNYYYENNNLVSNSDTLGTDTKYVPYWYNYSSKKDIFILDPITTAILTWDAQDKGLITEEQRRQYNYYYLNGLDTTYTNFDFSQAVLYERNIIENIVFNTDIYIDDFNLKKRFNFGLTIPVRDENTKYFLFLNDYTRNTYDSINAKFKVITIDLPENYDSINYENYLYYDAILKKYLAPAGAEIKIYTCNVDSGNIGTLTLLESYTGERNPFTWNNIDMTYYIMNGFIDSNANTYYLLDTLIPTSAITYNNFLSNIFINALDFYTSITGDKFVISSFLNFFNVENTEDFVYKYLLQVFYYDFNLLESYDNFIGGNSNIVSYENSRNSWNKQNIYNLFRKTNVYTQENKFFTDSFAFNYSDSEDITSLLPENTDTNYLSSPIYKDNVESSSGGYITYNITNIYNYNDTIINYGQEDSNMREPTDENYYKDFNTNNNIVIDSTLNEDIKIVELTSDTKGLIGKIYETLLRIENKIENIGDVVTNNVDNITNTTKNYFTILFVPDFAELKEDLEEVNETAEEHLGFIYEPFVFIAFLFESIQDLNDDYIVFHSPPIELFGYEIFPEVYFDFNEQLFNINEYFITLRGTQLLLCNATMIFMFINFMIRTYEGVFKDDN